MPLLRDKLLELARSWRQGRPGPDTARRPGDYLAGKMVTGLECAEDLEEFLNCNPQLDDMEI